MTTLTPPLLSGDSGWTPGWQTPATPTWAPLPVPSTVIDGSPLTVDGEVITIGGETIYV